MEQTTSFIKSIPEFADTLVALLRSPYGWLVFLGLLVWLLVNKNTIGLLAHLSKRDALKQEKLDAHIEKSNISDPKVLAVVKDIRDANHFKHATGIYATKRQREAIIDLYNKVSHGITWKQICRAMEFMEFSKDLGITYRTMTRFERFAHHYNIFTSISLLVLAALILIALLISAENTPMEIILRILGLIFCMFFSAFSYMQNWPYICADEIREELKKQAIAD